MELKKGETINSKDVEIVCGICAENQHATQDYPTIYALQDILQEQSNAIKVINGHLVLQTQTRITLVGRTIPSSVGGMDQL